MPYKLSENGLCVHMENADGTLGDVVKCHETHEGAVAHMRALYAHVEDAAKERAADSLTIHKQADGKYRWLIVSSSSFMDRDREIVSQAALEEDTERMNQTKEFGTLDWWHTPIRLGACDFSAMHGRLSIESGIFEDDVIAEKLAEHANELAASRSFRHSVSEPDASGTYNHIRTFARAILPRGREANTLTQVSIASGEQSMLKEKILELKQMLGGNKEAEEKVDALLASAEKAEQDALAAGVTHKEQTPEATPEAKPAEALKEDKPAWFLADMKPEEFGALIGTAMQTAIAPLVAEVKELKEAQAASVKEAVTASGSSILAEIGKLAQKQAEQGVRLGALEGLTPRGYRSTQDPTTQTTKDAKPGDDPRAGHFASFVTRALGGAEGPQI